MLLYLFLPFLIASSSITASKLDRGLQTFAQNAVSEGKVVFLGSVRTEALTYDLFILEQDERRGVMLVTNGYVDQPGKASEILFADTSLDTALDLNLVTPEIAEQLNCILGVARSPAISPQMISPAEDIYPIGTALNTVLGPIAGFTFRSNGTLGILQELEQSDAIPVTPSTAPPGSILVCPTTYSSTGPVSLGSVAVLGSDGKVYGLDVRKSGAWTSLGTVATWIEKNGANHQVFGFLLRAHTSCSVSSRTGVF